MHGGTTEEGNCSYLLPLSHRAMHCITHCCPIMWEIFTVTFFSQKDHGDIIKWQHFPDYWLFAQRPVTRSFDIFFDLRLNKLLSKQWWGWSFETPSRPLWRHCNVPYPLLISCKLYTVIASIQNHRYGHHDVMIRKWIPYYWSGGFHSQRGSNADLRCFLCC